ncbi:tripartite tricarboxylate transporter substrate binding protein [Verticiella sediminum]|uniref:Tripartite tricarboxylate transporter substrate binding protein n=1 Tax=Verticiella sediminum TaxID=1247510 RepID=A0A556B1K7_9BURK|nr:tripartite tricarboxylate transporter substrate binding protein [Verticiella sediminum]TSH98625.1 tripartite tricarboxylate transporter substrate binding protein [Verticiella sediminum]
MNPFKRTVEAALLLLALAGTTVASAAYPERPVRLIVPFAAGGGTDAWARLFAARLGTELGQSVLVENRPGANTQVGATAVANAEPDGYTLLFTTSTHIQIPSLVRTLPYDVINDFAPVAQLGATGLIFAVNPQVKAANMGEFLAEARAAKNWSVGTYAAGSAGAVFSQAILKDEGLDIPVIVYKGEAPAITDVVGGQTQGGFFSVPSVKSLAQAGKLKPIGNLSATRSPSFPNVPTLLEQGFSTYRWPGTWLGVFAPARTPEAVLERLTLATQAVAQNADFRTEWADRDVVVNWRGPEPFRQEILADMKTWDDLVHALDIKPEQ